jgi:deoxyhypusine synthase
MQSKLLRHPTIPPNVKKNKSASVLLDEMLGVGFQGRALAEAFAIWKQMLSQKKITIWLGISGAIIPAGMRKLLSYLIQQRMVDVIVSTGAQIFHDVCEAMGVKHFQGSSLVDDMALKGEGIDRFYNVYVKEQLQRRVDRQIQDFIHTLHKDYQYSSREFFKLLGKHLDESSQEKDSILIQAARCGIPIYAPALNDSSIGYSFIMARHGMEDGPDGKSLIKTNNKIFRYIDQMKDTDETMQIAAASPKSGVIYLGGGVPKNFIQQTELLNVIMGKALPGHEYAVQITTDTPHFGGLSGCTFEEGQSWGKISEKAKKVQCFCDLTIALPLLINGLADYENLAAKRSKPNFDWKDSGQVQIKYK